MNFSVFTKQICRFLIQRYMGQYLRTELTSDQLEFHLSEGTATVQGVMLNAEYINETLDSSGIKIFTLKDGYVNELTVAVPWKRLLIDSTLVKVSDLQLTVTPLAELNLTNTQELVSSFVGSIASSMDLAKSVIVDEQLANETDNAGIENCANIIDQIIARIKVVFENVTIRIESYSSELCTGIEVQIDRMEFLDEQLQEQLRNEPITDQPGRLYTVTDLNKLLHIQGMRLYTDIWSPIKENRMCNSRISEADPDSGDMTNSSFQSCYSHFSSRSNSNTSRPKSHDTVAPNPTLFAQLFDERHTLRIEVKNNSALSFAENSFFNKRVDIQLFLGGPLYMFITPSQLMLLKGIFSLLIPKSGDHKCDPSNDGVSSKNCGTPMGPEQYAKLLEQIQQGECKPSSTGVNFGTWSGSDRFFDLSEPNHDGQNKEQMCHLGKSNKSSDNNSLEYKQKGMLGQTHRQSNTSISTLVERRPDIFSFSVRAPSVIAVITHEDPLGIESFEWPDAALVSAVIQEMNDRAAHFFAVAEKLKMSKKNSEEQRRHLLKLYDGDCLRLTANGVHATLTLTNDSQRNSLELAGEIEEFDFLECLQQEPEPLTVNIMNVSSINKRGNLPKGNDVFNFRFKNTLEAQNEYTISIETDHCLTDLDFSLIDRISNLISVQPFFHSNNKPKFAFAEESDEIVGGLNENFTMDKPNPTTSFAVTFNCRSCICNLRVPIADLSNKVRDYRKRLLYPEYLQLELESVCLELPRFSASNLSLCWSINVKCKSAKGAFVGDPFELQCKKEEMTFLYASPSMAEKAFGTTGITFELHYDARNKSLSKALLHNTENLMARSMFESVYRPSEDESIDGPFSKRNSYFTFTDTSDFSLERRLIMTGNRSELSEFARECRQKTNISIELSISQVHLAFPSRKFFEVFYNRIANDLILWKPKSPKFNVGKERKMSQEREFTACQSSFIPFNAFGLHNEAGDDPNNQPLSTPPNGNDLKLADSHFFTFGVQVEKVQALLQTSVEKDEDNSESNDTDKSFNSQLVANLIQSEFFYVYGFLEDPGLAYCFLNSSKAELFHHNMFDGETPMFTNILDPQRFAIALQKENACFEEIPNDQQFDRVQDDNFTISMKIHFHPEPNTKGVFVALGLRNSFIHLKPVSSPKHFWIAQFANFFAVNDYGVPGYAPPAIDVDLRVHLESMFLGYDHSAIVPTSPFQLRFEIGFSYLTSRIVENIERLKFDCIFQDIKMWMLKKGSPKFDSTNPGLIFNPSNSSLAKVFHSDFIHFTTACTISVGEVPGPLFEFACINKTISIWLCPDTIVEFLNVLFEFSRSDKIKKLMSCDARTATKAQQEPIVKLDENSGEMNAQQKTPHQSINTSKNQGSSYHKQISPEDEERLIKRMEAAMNDMPFASTQPKMRSDGINLFGITEESPEENHSSNSMTDEEEFILIEKIHPSQQRSANLDFTQSDKSAFRTQFDGGGDFEFITTQINANKSPLTGHLDELPTNLLAPLFRFKLKDISLRTFLFGGTDFGDSSRAMSQKTYSQWTSSNLDRRKSEEIGSHGGKYRDHTVIVEIDISKLSFVCELFDLNSPVLSLLKLKVEEFRVLDHLSISQINEMVHRLEEEGRPRRVASPFLSCSLIEDQLREAKVSISLSPIRLNIDQDTIEFLMDFKNEIIQSLQTAFDFDPMNLQKSGDDRSDVPVMEIPRETNISDGIYPKLGTPKHDSDLTMSFNVLKTADELMANDNAKNLDELFSEDDVNFGDSFCEKSCANSETPSSGSGTDPEGVDKNAEGQPTSSTAVDGESEVTENSRNCNANVASGLAAKETFIKDFLFFPTCRLRIDYEAKRVKTDQQGALIGFLIGMANLNKTELTLKELHIERGFLGVGKCVQYAIDEWVLDIRTKQFPNVVGSVAPLNALVQLAQGFHDLFAFPLNEFRKEDGQLFRGIRRGTSSFGLNAATAAIDATQRMIGLVQNVAELAFEIVNPDFERQRQRRIIDGHQRVQIAGDFREGLSLAYSTVREGFLDTAQTLQAAAADDRGGWGMNILRQMTPSAIKPLVIASKATSQLLGGLKNQLKPGEHREERRKWRQSNANKQGFEQLRRQSSSGSIPSVSSSGSFQPNFEQQRRNW